MRKSEFGMGFVAHHVDDSSGIGELHNLQHGNIVDRLTAFKSGSGGIKEARSIVEDATQLKITASLLDGDGNQHLDEVKNELNEQLPPNNKFVLSTGKTSLK